MLIKQLVPYDLFVSVPISHLLTVCESTSRRFHPGEGPCRIFANLCLKLYSSNELENYLFAPEIAESDAGLPARAPAEVVEAPDGAAVVAVVPAAGPAPSAAAPPAPPHARLGSALLSLGNGDQHQHRQQQHLAAGFDWVSVNTELYTCNLFYEAVSCHLPKFLSWQCFLLLS